MNIIYTQNKYGYFYEIHVDFCCAEMEDKYDFSHKRTWCISQGFQSGKIRIFGGYDTEKDEYEYFDINNCPFCGEKIELEEHVIWYSTKRAKNLLET